MTSIQRTSISISWRPVASFSKHCLGFTVLPSVCHTVSENALLTKELNHERSLLTVSCDKCKHGSPKPSVCTQAQPKPGDHWAQCNPWMVAVTLHLLAPGAGMSSFDRWNAKPGWYWNLVLLWLSSHSLNQYLTEEQHCISEIYYDLNFWKTLTLHKKDKTSGTCNCNQL